jgi:ketosteroid isomerase-like protein
VSAETNRRLLDELLEAMCTNDRDAITRLTDPEIKYWIPQTLAERHGWARPIVGHEGLFAMAELAATRYTEVTLEARHTVADDEGVAAWLAMSTPRADGSGVYTNEYAFVLKVADGRITEVWEQPDTALSLDSFGRR